MAAIEDKSYSGHEKAQGAARAATVLIPARDP